MLEWLFRKRAREQEINAELRYHLEMLSRDGIEQGLTAAEAEAAARRRLGNATAVRETVSEIWGWPSAEALSNDIRYALRTLRKNPRFTIAAVLSLGLGIGMATAIFTLVNSILLHSLPFADPDRIVMIWSENKLQGWDHEKMSFPEILDWEKTGIFDRVVGFVPNMGTITAPGDPELVHGYAVTPGALAMLGVQPMLGRPFTPQEERRGGPGAVILRYNVWQRRYGNPDVIGQTVLFNDTQRTIVGVMPPSFEFFNRESDLIFPAYIDPSNVTSRGRFLRVMARLKPGLSLREAQTRANVVAANLAAQYPESNRGWTTSLVPLPIDTAGAVRPALLMLMGAVGMVMLIACSNVACLLLAQAGARSKELAVRLALGATRWRLARQVLIESLLLAVLGGVLGLVLSESAIRYFRNILPDRYSTGRYLLQLDQIRVDAWVFAFAGLVVIVSAAFFGLVPALRAARSDLNEGLKETGRGSSSGRRARRGQNLLVIAQLAVAVVLVIGAGLLIKSFARLYQQGPGFRPENLKTADIQLPSFELQSRSRDEYRKWFRTNYEQVMDRVASLPGIEAVASVNDLPMNGFYWLNDFTVENRPQRDPSDSVRAIDRWVWPAYFETMGIPLISGRYFSRRNTEEEPLVVIVNDAFVKHYLDGQDPIGRRVKSGPPSSPNPWHTIVGVVAGERCGGMDEEPRPMIYYSASQYPQGFFHLIVRSHMDLAGTVTLLRSELKKINPKIAPYAPTTFDRLVLDSTWRVRCSMLLLGVLAAVSLITAMVGVYGVIDYGVSERAAEIGIRMALGASGADMMRMITGEGVRVASIGIALGLGLALILTRLLSTLLFGVRAIDGWIYAGVALLLVAVSALASFAPARRGARLDPISTLRQQ